MFSRSLRTVIVLLLAGLLLAPFAPAANAGHDYCHDQPFPDDIGAGDPSLVFVGAHVSIINSFVCVTVFEIDLGVGQENGDDPDPSTPGRRYYVSLCTGFSCTPLLLPTGVETFPLRVWFNGSQI